MQCECRVIVRYGQMYRHQSYVAKNGLHKYVNYIVKRRLRRSYAYTIYFFKKTETLKRSGLLAFIEERPLFYFRIMFYNFSVVILNVERT